MSTADALAWEQVGNTEDELLTHLLDFYWEAIEIEIADAILSLNNIFRLQKRYPEADIGPQELEHRVSARLGPPVLAWNPLELDFQQQIDCIEEARELTLDQQNVEGDYLLARMMLGGMNMLDIDEIMEYRDPPLPSQKGPPRCLAIKGSSRGLVEIFVLECDVCGEPLRGLAWTCRMGCGLETASRKLPTDSFDVCMDCYNEDKHPRQHLLRSPHHYAISESLKAELSDEEFWAVRREIQRKQDELDLQLDQSKGGILGSAVTRSLANWSRSIFPLGNVHAGVMFGPLIFEIGVKDSKNGARISCRHPPRFGKSWRNSRLDHVLALDPDRVLHKACGVFPERYVQATVKQIVGGLFAGYHQHLQSLEKFVVNLLLAAAHRWTEKPLKSRQSNYLALRKHANAIITAFRLIMDGYLKPYLKAITSVLFDRQTELRWSQYTNNCQSFCDTIFQQPVFSTVFPSVKQLYSLRTDCNVALLDYILSFRTEPQLGNALNSSRLSIGPMSAFLKLLHRQTDVLEYQEEHGRRKVDSTPLCADIFAWRCHDQECNLADHVWTNPAEFASILQFHLMLDNTHYLQLNNSEQRSPAPLDEIQWVKNRLAVLQANDSFATAAAGIARAFQKTLKKDSSRSWRPPKAPSIPQDVPFMMADDEVQYAQEDPGSGPSYLGRWFSRTEQNGLAMELPRAYGPSAVAMVVPGDRETG